MKQINSKTVFLVLFIGLLSCGNSKEKEIPTEFSISIDSLVNKMVAYYKHGKEIGDISNTLDSLQPVELHIVIERTILELEYLNPELFYWISKLDKKPFKNTIGIQKVFSNETHSCIRLLWEITFCYLGMHDSINKEIECIPIDKKLIVDCNFESKDIVKIYNDYSDYFGY